MMVPWICTAAAVIGLVVVILGRSRSTATDEVEIEALYRSRCTSCGQTCTPGDRIFWHRKLKTVRHADCSVGFRTRQRDFVAKALDRIAAGGPGTRKTAVEAALQQLAVGSPERQEFLIEVARHDVAATLDKVDSLKSAAAKRRHLQAALDRLTADEVPDELQAEQFQWLRDALRSLESKH